MDDLKQLLRVTMDYKLPLRITEAATLSYGGVQVGREQGPHAPGGGN